MDSRNFLLMGAYYAVCLFLSIVALNSRQVYRPFLMVGIVTFAILSFRQVTEVYYAMWGTEVFCMYLLIYLSHMGCALFVEKYVLPPKPGVTFDWGGGFRMAVNGRWLGTSRQSPDIREPAKQKRQTVLATESEERQQEYIKDPSKRIRTMLRSPRAVFIRSRALSFIGTVICERLYRYLYAELAPQYVTALELTDFTPKKQTYFRRLDEVTLRETVIRIWLATYFVFYSRSVYNSIHDGLAIFFVGTGFDEPEDWPPLFGDIRDATTIRNFWSKFWHRLVYRSYTSYGIWISKNILRLPKSSFIGRLFVNLFVFTMSGCVHAVAFHQLGMVCGVKEEIVFYASSFPAILLEMAVIAAFTKITRGYQLSSTISKTIGYTWVSLFLFTTLPKSQYPKVFCV